ncbi:MAG: enoyl-CoA hydratase/isomerase family protein [Salinirussus sp.]
MANYDYLDVTVADGRAEIVLDRPDVLNAFHKDMVDELLVALYEANRNDAVYAILLTGAGRAFCAGADISSFGEGGQDDELAANTRLRNVQSIVRELYAGEKPTVAAINGPALGAGADWALATDLRVMGEDAFIREQFVNIGLIPGDGGGWILPRLVGEAKAKEWVLLGEDITPDEAVESGLVREVVPTDEVRATGRELANALRDKPAAAVRGAKELTGFDRSFEDYCQDAVETQWEVRTDPEHDEAIAALNEDREPDFDRPY